MLRLKSLGQTLIEVDGARLTPVAETLFAIALYLVMEAGKPVGRDELARLIWPNVSETRAQHGLRQVLYKLKSIGAEIETNRTSVALRPRSFEADYTQLLTPQQPTALEALSDKMAGPFLPGYDPHFSKAFAIWVERRRDFVQSAMTRVLVVSIGIKKGKSDWTAAERLAKECLGIDPLNEEATLTIAESAALGGSKAKALSILNHYLDEIGADGREIRLPAVLLRRRISEAYQDNAFSVRDVPFVGRDDEMAELTRALSRAQGGNGSAYLIWGEPGIGKTRLVTEFTRAAALQRVNIVRVGCQSHDVRRPLSAFVDLVPKLLALPGALGCSPESMIYLRRLTAHDPTDARNREELEPLERRDDQAHRALIDVLDAVSAESCCVLQLEDAHWLDHQSLQLVEELANWLVSRHVLFLLTSRAKTCANECISGLMLRPLERDASSRVAYAIAEGDGGVERDFISWCVSSSGGNPYYLTELLRNGIREHDGYQPPASLSRLLQTRVLLLSSKAKSLLEVCCILGKHSTMARIESCAEASHTELLGALVELETAGMIELDGERLLSRHELLTSVVLTNMSAVARAMLHRFVATQLEAEATTTQSVSLLWESSEHWYEAADASRAILLLRRCGSHLMDIGMPEEAIPVLSRADVLAVEPDEKYSIGADRARALLRSERPSEAVDVLKTLLLLKTSIHPSPPRLDEVGLMYLQACWESGGSLAEIIDPHLDDLRESNALPQDRAEAAAWFLSAADNLCDFALASRIYEFARELVASDRVAPGTRLMLDVVYHCSFGNGELAHQRANELSSYARDYCTPSVTMRYLRHASHVFRCHGSIEESIAVAAEAFAIAERLKSCRSMAMCAANVGSILMQAGEVDRAEEWIKRATTCYSPGSTSVADNNMLSHLTEMAIRREDIQSAEAHFSRSSPAVSMYRSPRSFVRKLALEARIALLRETSLSQTFLDQFVNAFEATKSFTLQDYQVVSLVDALAASGRNVDASRVANDFVSRSRRDLSPWSADLSETMSRLSAI
jgi:DNA-binding SARP family transcriptional activator